MGSLTQTNVLFKGFSEGSQKTLDFTKVDADVQDFHMSPILRSALVEQILSRPNEEAVEVLSSVGELRRVPIKGNCCITRHEVARFYGVSEDYIASLMNRLGYTSAKKREDIRKTDRFHVLSGTPGVEECSVQTEMGYVQYRSKSSPPDKVEFVMPERSSQFLLFSPRIVLALALGMTYTEKTQFPGPIKRTLLAIKASNYRVSKKNYPEIPGLPAGFSIPVTPDGNLVLSPELFISLIHETVKETISAMGGVSELEVAHNDDGDDQLFKRMSAHPDWNRINKLYEQHKISGDEAAKLLGFGVNNFRKCRKAVGLKSVQFAPNKCKRPDNWDDLVSRVRSGEMKCSAAAKAAGMCPATFRSYYNGHSTW